MIRIPVLVSILLCVGVHFVAALVNTKEFRPAIYTDLAFSSCASLGKDYYNPSNGTCLDCAAGMMKDTSDLNSQGDAIKCKCALGYYKSDVNCFGTSDATCDAFTCTLCSTLSASTPAGKWWILKRLLL